ncbi:vomeronasal type-1 receptor 3-like [Tachyglossus aculeatus]|uniref:vomeronasal type-1 receptor 3-like n=1 Tax=Tachyglossus aculeatus TaxID=9261 RepID=UPI0018F7AB77|nr:vomeronasal type-1 receptor 3-like [Tachyglossus aculeatus]
MTSLPPPHLVTSERRPSKPSLLDVPLNAPTGVGVLGNTMLLTVYVNIFISQPHQKKPTDLILLHFTVANTVILLTRGVSEAIVAFGMNSIPDDVGCQAITISPSTSPLAKFKFRAPSYILLSLVFSWIFNLLIYIEVAAFTRATKNVTIMKSLLRVPYELGQWLHGGCVILTQHIHSSSLSPKSSLEINVIQTILLLNASVGSRTSSPPHQQGCQYPRDHI